MHTETSKRRILVVDEDAHYAASLAELLQGKGYDVSIIGSPQDVVTAVLIARPDLALIDVRFPGGSGLVVGATLRSNFDVPFIVLSRVDDAETALRATEAGAVAYLVKTLHIQHFMATIQGALVRADELRQLRRRVVELTKALQQTRAVGMTIGVLMERSGLSRDQAFERLRGLARRQRRRVRDVAEQFLDAVECLNGVVGSSVLPPFEDSVES